MIGHVDLAGKAKVDNEDALANKLLTFAVNGLLKPYTIPTEIYPVNSLTAEQLYELSKEVIKEVESLGNKVNQ